jgi:ClpX C4-type zinc finger
MQSNLEGKVCSFCGNPGSRKNRLAGGLGAMICMECLDVYYHHSRSAKRVAQATGPVWHEMSDAELLSKLPLILRSAAQNTEFAHDWVALIRARGLSWAEIGKVLGVSRQAAWERFAVGERHAASKSGRQRS